MTGPDPLRSRIEIADLVHRYALNVRRRHPEASADLFTEDATFEVRELDFADPAAVARSRSRDVGRTAVVAHIATSAGGAVRVCPSVSNLIVEIAGETASANCLMASRLWPGDRQMVGEYDDSFRFEAGRWLFSGRVYTIFLPRAA